jgi:hypothetical protein
LKKALPFQISSMTAVMRIASTIASRRALSSLGLVVLFTWIRLLPPDPDYLRTLNKFLSGLEGSLIERKVGRSSGRPRSTAVLLQSLG